MLKFIKKNIKNFIILIFVVAVAVWGYILYRHHKEQNPNNIPMVVVSAVQAVEPELKNVSVAYSYIGRVDAVNDAVIVPYISGYITDIKARGGQTVKKDDTLLIIKQDEYRAQVMSSLANVMSAQADAEYAQRQFLRMQKAGPKAVSATELDNAKTDFLTAKATLQQAQAAYYTALINLNYTVLKAPFDGVIGNISPSVGDFISPESGAIMRIVQYNPIRVVFSVTDREFSGNIKNLLPTENTVKLLLPDGKEYSETGKVKYTANEVDETTNSVAVYAEFANPDKELMPNAYVKVLWEHQYNDVVLLDKSLVVAKNDGNYAYTVSDGILELSKIDILADKDNSYVLGNTFKSGQMIVAENVDSRLVGQKVNVKKIMPEK
jgi:membrane fusion protein (multidrug efflux system)